MCLASLPRRQFFLGVGFLLVATAIGCQPAEQRSTTTDMPAVPVSKPIARQITDFVDFTGRTDAVESVNIVPRVTGYLDKIAFKEGSEVKAGDLLFKIDPRPYKSQLDQVVGQVALYKAQLELAKTTLARDVEVAKTPGAMSAQQLDQDRAAVIEAEARVKANEASTEVYKLNLDFTQVKSPISGQISRYFLTTGNLVNQDQTLLTTVVSLEPMYAYFDMDEQTLLRFRRAINEGKIKMGLDGALPVSIGLQGEEGFPHKGTINFVNNQVNSSTGSISVRGVFPNTKPPNGARLLSPGMFVRVRLPLGEPHPALLVIDRAISSDQGIKYVYVLDAQNKVQYRRVITGSLQEDGLRVVNDYDQVKKDGLKPDDYVVVGGLQLVRPGMEIKPQYVDMPSLGQRPDEAPAPTKAGKAADGKKAPAPDDKKAGKDAKK